MDGQFFEVCSETVCPSEQVLIPERILIRYCRQSGAVAASQF